MIGIVIDSCDEEQDIPLWDILGVLPRTLWLIRKPNFLSRALVRARTRAKRQKVVSLKR